MNNLQLPDFKSMHEILEYIIDNPKINMIRFPKGKSEAPISAFIRVQTGETLKDESVGHARLASKKIVGLERDNLFLTIPRDKSTRILDNGEFGYRTIPIASPVMGQRVHAIEILPNFSSEWIEIDLDNLPVFPHPTPDMVKWFAEGMQELYQLFAEKKFLSGQLTSLKKTLGKDKEVLAQGYRFHWEDPNSTVQAVVDNAGNKIGTVPTAFNNGVCLKPEFEAKLFQKITDTSRIVETYLKHKEVCAKASMLNSELRPFELGVIERNSHLEILDTITIGWVNFKLERSEVKRYDYPKDTVEKLQLGEYQIAQVPKTLGEWLCDPIAVPVNKTLVPTS